LKKRKTFVAAALATAGIGFGVSPARADMTSCWVSQKNSTQLKATRCDHTISTDDSGVRWNQLVYAHNGNGVRIAFFRNKNGTFSHGIMTMLDGSNRVRTTAWQDKDGDYRVKLGNFSIAFTPSNNPRIASLGRSSGGTINASIKRPAPRTVEVEELLQGF